MLSVSPVKPAAPSRRSTAVGQPRLVKARRSPHRSVIDEPAELSERKADERQKLLEAAKAVLERSGWWGFKVESVLRQARLSTRSFYRHFDSKTDLLMALLQEELGGAAVRLRRVTAAAGTPVEKIHAFVAATIDLAYRESSAKPSSLFASRWRDLLPDYPDEIERCIQNVMAPLVEAVRDAASIGAIKSADAEADARVIFHLVASMTADQAAGGARTPRAEIEELATSFIDRAIGLA